MGISFWQGTIAWYVASRGKLQVKYIIKYLKICIFVTKDVDICCQAEFKNTIFVLKLFEWLQLIRITWKLHLS